MKQQTNHKTRVVLDIESYEPIDARKLSVYELADILSLKKESSVYAVKISAETVTPPVHSWQDPRSVPRPHGRVINLHTCPHCKTMRVEETRDGETISLRYGKKNVEYSDPPPCDE